ncbi:MAG TPA: YqeG family HAD IIIA-type phosphatase [Coriobacteriia bacterium]
MSKRLLSPDAYLGSVTDVDPEALRADGVDALLVDLDNTLVPRDSGIVPDEIRAWAGRAHAAGLSVCVVSNNWHGRVHSIASDLGFEMVDKALKPLPFAFRRALRKLGASVGASAVVGDQLFTDVLGGNLLGMRTILVLPLSASDLPHTLLLRKIEARLLAGRTPSP